VLTAAGTEVTPQELVPEVYIPEKRGSLQLELVAAIRRRGLIPYPLEPDFVDLVGELRSGRPVLVMQNLGFQKYPVWHYAVVVGFEPRGNRVLLRSGIHERLNMSARKFRSTWKAADRWGIVVLHPGGFPATVDAEKYLSEVAALEALGHWHAAHRGYSAALRRWPGNELALLGLGNVHYRLGELGPAESAYLSLIKRDPGHPVALNNLAQVLADRGCPLAAHAAIERALANDSTAGGLREALLGTRSEINDDTQAPATHCPTVL
jgi:hypothetical protein